MDQQVGKTEVISNTLSPTFAKPIRVKYSFEDIQRVVIKVFDVDSASGFPKEENVLGHTECTLGQVCLLTIGNIYVILLFSFLLAYLLFLSY